VPNGATEAEASEAGAAATRLEARLGFQVAPLTPAAPRLGLRGRIYRSGVRDGARGREPQGESHEPHHRSASMIWSAARYPIAPKIRARLRPVGLRQPGWRPTGARREQPLRFPNQATMYRVMQHRYLQETACTETMPVAR
jgi:hypothetical protein